MSWNFDKQLTEILEDNRSGSRAITVKVSRLFRQLISKEDVDRSEIINRLRSASRKLEKAHPALVSLGNMCDSVLLIVDTAPPREELIKRLNRLFDDWGELFEERTTLQIAGHLYQRLDEVKTIFSHSHSSTIHTVFKHIAGKNTSFSFVQTVAWPAREGVTMAKMLAALNYPVELIADAGIAEALQQVDMVLLGADSIRDNRFVNKQGSLAICLLAKQFGKPVYLIADSSKLDRSETPKEIQRQNPRELMEEEIDSITVNNRYFEPVPLSLVTGILLQSGAYSPEGVARMLTSGSGKGRQEVEQPAGDHAE